MKILTSTAARDHSKFGPDALGELLGRCLAFVLWACCYMNVVANDGKNTTTLSAAAQA